MKKLILLLISVLILALLLVLPKPTKPRSFYLDKHDPDTLKFNEVFKGVIELNKKEVTKPNHVLEFLPDTTIRKQVENATIITKVALFNPLFKPKKLIINKIDTKGIVYETTYKIPFASTFQIDHKGDVKVKKYRVLKFLVATTAISLVSFVTYKAFKK